MSTAPLTGAHPGTASLLHAVWHRGPLTLQELRHAVQGASSASVQEKLETLLADSLISTFRVNGATVYGAALDQEPAARRRYAALTGARSCRKCGCSDAWACDQGCWWTEPDLCSACVDGEG